MDIVGEKYFFNGEIKNLNEFQFIDLKGYEVMYEVIYEVIRIIDKQPIFYEDHINRLNNSLKAIKASLKFSSNELKLMIARLLELNEKISCNIKIIVLNNNNMQDICIYISKSYYPSQEEIAQGVETELLYLDRENPNLKMLKSEYKDFVTKVIKEKNVFEVILVSKDNIITEGSRSNLFFIKDNKVFTAPSKLVLEGITRKYIINVCSNAGIEVVEGFIGIQDLKNVTGAFISGTSIKVLPISRISNYLFDSGKNQLIISIRDKFDELIKKN